MPDIALSGAARVHYLKSPDQAAGLALLARAGTGGYAWPAANGWVPLVAPDSPRSLAEALSEGQALLRFSVESGTAWGFELLGAGRRFLRYRRAALPAPAFEHELLDENLHLLLSLMVEHGPPDRAVRSQAELRAALRPALFPASGGALGGEAPQERFARLLGLSPWAGLVWEELPSDAGTRWPGVVRVPARGLRRSGAQ